MTMPRLSRKADPNVPKNTPIFAYGAAVLLTAFAVVVIVSGNGGKNSGQLLVGLIITTVPSILAAGFAERVSRDVRNGTVVEKSRQGTHQALHEAGVITRSGPVVTQHLQATEASLTALRQLIERQAKVLEHKIDERNNHDDNPQS